MAYKEANYDQLYPYSPFLNMRIGATKSVGKGKDLIDEWMDLADKCDQFYALRLKKMGIAIPDGMDVSLEPIENKKASTENDRLELLIKDSSDLDELLSYKLLIKEDFKELFEKRISELTPKYK